MKVQFNYINTNIVMIKLSRVLPLWLQVIVLAAVLAVVAASNPPYGNPSYGQPPASYVSESSLQYNTLSISNVN